MKPIMPDEKLLSQLQEMEKKKQYTTMNVNMKSVFVGYSRAGIPPSYFLRADYLKDQSEGRLPVEFWQVPNPEDPYFVDRKPASTVHRLGASVSRASSACDLAAGASFACLCCLLWGGAMNAVFNIIIIHFGESAALGRSLHRCIIVHIGGCICSIEVYR